MAVTYEYTASSAGDSGPGDACGEASPPLHGLARAPVLLVGEVPELHRIAGIEVRPGDGLGRERPGALDRGPVGGDRDQPVRHHVVRVQAEQHVREDVDVDDGAQALCVEPAERHAT